MSKPSNEWFTAISFSPAGEYMCGVGTSRGVAFYSIRKDGPHELTQETAAEMTRSSFRKIRFSNASARFVVSDPGCSMFKLDDLKWTEFKLLDSR